MRSSQRRALALAIVLSLFLTLFGPIHDAIPHTHGEALAQEVTACTAEEHNASKWHLPYLYIPDVRFCYYGHEHGDGPPDWIAAAGYEAGFDAGGGFHGNTSAAENTHKHAAMKGWYEPTYRDYSGGRVELYARVHIASNVLDRTAQYHSYEMFMLDAAGGVSRWQGHFDAGNPEEKRFLYDGRNDPGIFFRPLILTQNEQTFPTVKNEHWYMRAAVSWNWDFAWTVDPTTFHRDGEVYDLDVSHWLPTGRLGTVRRFEPAWYGPDSRIVRNRGNPPRGVEFWATPRGEIVSGPDDLRCFPQACLSNYIALTARSIEAGIPGGNARERVFPGIGLGVKLPN